MDDRFPTTPGSGPAGRLVSVVIPTKDRLEHVRRAVASALAQEGVEVEVVVVDDGSRDGTAEALSGLDRVALVRHDTPRGVAAARNAGVAAATGTWVAFLDDDDLWAPGKLRAELGALDAAGARWGFAGAIVVDERGRVVDEEPAPSAEEFARQLPLCNPVPAGSSNVIAHRDLLAAAGGFDPALQHFADWDLWARLAAIEPPATAPELVVGYVRHASNMHVSDVRGAQREIAVLAERLERTTGRRLDGRALQEWIADGHARAGQHWRAARTLAVAGAAWRSPRYLRRAAAEAARALHVLSPRLAADLGEPPPWARIAQGDGAR